MMQFSQICPHVLHSMTYGCAGAATAAFDEYRKLPPTRPHSFVCLCVSGLRVLAFGDGVGLFGNGCTVATVRLGRREALGLGERGKAGVAGRGGRGVERGDEAEEDGGG